jgi:structure-specific recognition protein 1
MEETPQLLKGINYGLYNFTKDHLTITRDNKNLLQIRLDKISNTSVVNRQDVALELQTDELGENDTLCEMRFYIPSKADNKDDDEEKEDKEVDEEKEDKGSDMEEEDKPETLVKAGAEILNELIISKANLKQKAGDIIVSFNDLPFIVPRGKYSCDLSLNSLRLHGPTFNHIIQYKNITKAFLLPKPDDVHVLFVLNLEKPVRQGNTPYNYLVMQIKKDVQETVKLKLPPEDIEQQINEKLKEEYSGSLHDVVAKVFKSIIKISIIIPGGFESSTKHSGVKCSLKTSEGIIFFLTKSLIFVPKPVIYMKVDEIRGVVFNRLSTHSAHKLFDIIINLKSGQAHTFSGIDKKELDAINAYFTNLKVNVNIGKQDENEADMDDMEDDDDERGGGRRRSKPKVGMQAELDEDDDESEDEDFIAQEDDESDDEEDGDFDEEEDDEKPKKKKAAK